MVVSLIIVGRNPTKNVPQKMMGIVIKSAGVGVSLLPILKYFQIIPCNHTIHGAIWGIFESFEISSVVQMRTQISNKIQTLILHQNSIYKNSLPEDIFFLSIAIDNITLKKVLKSTFIESQKHYPSKLILLVNWNCVLACLLK
eukprot:gene9410-1618_t